MASHQLEEVLTKYYPKLCSTLTDMGNLLPHFVKEGVITTDDLIKINAILLPAEKVQMLMAHISGPLRAGNTEVFYIMLRIMEEHGLHATKQLAHQIRRSLLPVIVDKESQHCGNHEVPGTTSPTKENSYKMNCLFWGAVLLGVLSIPVAILYGHNMVRSEVKMVSQKLEEIKHEIIEVKNKVYMLFMVSKDKQEIKGKVPLIDEDSQNIWLNNFLFDVEHQNATDWYNDLFRNSSKVEPRVTPAVVAVHCGFNDNFSNPFYIFDDGHLMRLRVYPNGYGDGEGTHVSVFLHLMKGPHDDKLEQSGHWPLRGTFTIELLNQLNDSDHYSRRLTFGTNCDYITRVGKDNSTAEGWGISQFISYDSLLMNNSYTHYNNNSFYFRISYNQIAPARLKVTGYTMKGGTIMQWVSTPFFAFEGGYQMHLKHCYIRNENNRVTRSLSLYLMKGPHDDKLEQSGHWPLRGTFIIKLYNEVGVQFPLIFIFSAYSCSQCTNRVVNGNVAAEGWNYSLVRPVHHNDTQRYIGYHFKVSYDDNNPPTLPVNLTVSNFTEKMKNKEIFSSPFFVFDKGYLMFIVIYAAGYGDGKGTHVSVRLRLMKGPHDDKLEQSGHWPLRGTFTIELLNQLNDSDHYSRMLQFHHHQCSVCTNRVLATKRFEVIASYSSSHGIQQFISHETLFNHSNNSYGSLNFKISYEDVEEVPYQVAPVIFKITKFSKWLKSNQEWSSNPFFAYEGGYQMCLRVDAASYGEGTHVSVYLHLMKGPHDDKLEQSGHWPLRGTFTIELLNQLNDSDHYNHEVIYSTEIDGDYTNRVEGSKTTCAEWGCHQFISHNILFNLSSSVYLKNDILILRISYKQNESFMDMLLGLFSS